LAGRLLPASLVLAVLSVLSWPAPAGATNTPRVLLLHAYHTGFQWTDNITEGVRQVLGQRLGRFELHTEYMDTKRHPPGESFPRLAGLYAVRYNRTPVDVIIASDDNALDFLHIYRDRLFDGVPVVFCGINNLTPARTAGLTEATGVAEDFDIASTLEAALALHPEADTVVSVSDATASSQLNLRRLRAVRHRFRDRVAFRELDGLEAPDLVGQVQALGKNSVIVHLNFFRDPSGRTFTQEDSIRLVAENTVAPVYSMWDWCLGHGIVGGMITSGVAHGRVAADMAADILEGADPGDIPVVTQSPNRYMFDHRQLERFGLDQGDLPAGSVVVNRPESLYARYKSVVWLIVAFLILQAAAITWLAVSLRHRRRLENALRASQRRYRDILATAPIGIFCSTPQGRYLTANPFHARMLGFDSPEDLARETADIRQQVYVDTADRDRLLHLLENDGEVSGFVSRRRRRDGSVIWTSLSARLVRQPDGRDHIDGFSVDVTRTVETEKELNRRLQEKDVLLREIHHRVKNNLQVVSSLLNLQAAQVTNPETRLVFDRSRDRIQTMAGVHEHLYRSLDLAGIDFAPYLDGLARQIRDSSAPAGLDIEMVLDLDNVFLPIDQAVPCGLIVNEALSNSFRHAFAGMSTGRVELSLRHGHGRVCLGISDNGTGAPPGVDPLAGDGLGFTLIQALAEQMGGELTLAQEAGMSLRLCFPAPDQEPQDEATPKEASHP
jgi:PAS domain S-box-containing protein